MMRLLLDFLRFYYECLAKFSTRNLLLTLLLGVILALLCWVGCNYYTRLWNKRYHLTLTQKALSAVAALLTFFFVTAYVGFAFLKEATIARVALWENALKADSQ